MSANMNMPVDEIFDLDIINFVALYEISGIEYFSNTLRELNYLRGAYHADKNQWKQIEKSLTVTETDEHVQTGEDFIRQFGTQL